MILICCSVYLHLSDIEIYIFGKGLLEVQQSFGSLFVAKLRGIIFLRKLTVEEEF